MALRVVFFALLSIRYLPPPLGSQGQWIIIPGILSLTVILSHSSRFSSFHPSPPITFLPNTKTGALFFFFVHGVDNRFYFFCLYFHFISVFIFGWFAIQKSNHLIRIVNPLQKSWTHPYFKDALCYFTSSQITRFLYWLYADGMLVLVWPAFYC